MHKTSPSTTVHQAKRQPITLLRAELHSLSSVTTKLYFSDKIILQTRSKSLLKSSQNVCANHHLL